MSQSAVAKQAQINGTESTDLLRTASNFTEDKREGREREREREGERDRARERARERARAYSSS